MEQQPRPSGVASCCFGLGTEGQRDRGITQSSALGVVLTVSRLLAGRADKSFWWKMHQEVNSLGIIQWIQHHLLLCGAQQAALICLCNEAYVSILKSHLGF